MWVSPWQMATLIAISGTAVASPMPNSLASQSLSPQTLYQLNVGSGIENIAVRANGQILATVLGPPVVLQSSPLSTEYPVELVTVPGATSLFGIAEIMPDVFAVGAGNLTSNPTAPVPGSYSIWHMDLRHGEPILSKLVDIPEAGLLNGMTAIPRQREKYDITSEGNATLLLADTIGGVVFHFDPTTLNYTVALSDETMAPPPPPGVPAGINGIRFRAEDHSLYYTNVFRQLFCRVRLSIGKTADGQPTVSAEGPFTVIASGFPGDDFALAPDGTAFVGANPVNAVFKVAPDGRTTQFMGGLNETIVAGATGAAFGRTCKDKNVLYITTNGGSTTPVNGIIEGGKLVAIQLSYST